MQHIQRDVHKKNQKHIKTADIQTLWPLVENNHMPLHHFLHDLNKFVINCFSLSFSVESASPSLMQNGES